MRKDNLHQHGCSNLIPHQLGCWRFGGKKLVAGYAKSHFLRLSFLKRVLSIWTLDVCWTFLNIHLTVPDSFSTYHKLQDQYNGAVVPLLLTWRLSGSVQIAWLACKSKKLPRRPGVIQKLWKFSRKICVQLCAADDETDVTIWNEKWDGFDGPHPIAECIIFRKTDDVQDQRRACLLL
jgi:hypothetical protein